MNMVVYRHEAAPGVDPPPALMAERLRFEGNRIAEVEVFIGPPLDP